MRLQASRRCKCRCVCLFFILLRSWLFIILNFWFFAVFLLLILLGLCFFFFWDFFAIEAYNSVIFHWLLLFIRLNQRAVINFVPLILWLHVCTRRVLDEANHCSVTVGLKLAIELIFITSFKNLASCYERRVGLWVLDGGYNMISKIGQKPEPALKLDIKRLIIQHKPLPWGPLWLIFLHTPIKAQLISIFAELS